MKPHIVIIEMECDCDKDHDHHHFGGMRSFVWHFGPVTEQHTKPHKPRHKRKITPTPQKRVRMAFDLGDNQEVDVSVTEVDHRGNPTSQTPATFTSDDESLLTVESTGDASATIRAVGPLGSGTVTVTAGNATESLDVHVIAEDAESINVTFGDPREQS